MAVPTRLASEAPNAGHVPEALTPYPRPARPSVPPPSAEFERHWANSPSSGRMSVAATLTVAPAPVKTSCTPDGGKVSAELSPQSLGLIRLPTPGKVTTLSVQRG